MDFFIVIEKVAWFLAEFSLASKYFRQHVQKTVGRQLAPVQFQTRFVHIYYFLLFGVMKPGEKYDVRVAQRRVDMKKSCKDEFCRLSDLRSILNNSFFKQQGYQGDRQPIRTLESRPENDRLLLGLADLFTGAIGYHWNGLHEKPEASRGALYLSRYIAEKVGKEHLRFTTSRYNRRFNIFWIKPAPEKKIRAPGILLIHPGIILGVRNTVAPWFSNE